MQGLALVAIESVMITHGIARPDNLAFAEDMEQAVREEGAVPATVGVLDGKILVGMGQDELERLAFAEKAIKISPRNFAAAFLQHSNGGTTLAGTMVAASKKDIKVLAAGGIGGVHVEQRFDVSADLKALSEIPMVVVCSGAQSILGLPATVEYLETMGVPVIGYKTDKFPEFFMPGKSLPVSLRLDNIEDIVKFVGYHWGLGQESAVLVCQSIPSTAALDRKEVEDAVAKASEQAKQQGIVGQKLTPFLFKTISDLTGGKSMRANHALSINNARLASQISRELAGLQRIHKDF